MSVRVLGIDPGTAIVGWAIIDEIDGAQISVAHGQITTSKEMSDADRLVEIADDLSSIIAKYRPAESAVEKLFFFKNQKTIITVAQARGVVLQILRTSGLLVAEYTPLQIKQAVTGYGRAEKAQVQEMVRQILGLAQIPKPDDVADALAVALCHLSSRRIAQMTKMM